MRDSLRSRVRFSEQRVIKMDDPTLDRPGSIQNLIYRTDDPALKWIENATSRIGDWRAAERSVFTRWAITINALHVARDRYRESPEIVLTIDTLRPSAQGPQRVHLDAWRGEEAARNHEATIHTMAAYAVQDMHGILEEIVLELYEVFVRGNPQLLMRGDDYKALRAAFRVKDAGETEAAAYAEMWEQRITGWRRNRTFDGLHRVFRTFWDAAGLARPSWYRATDVDDWQRVMETIGEVRHLVTHGENRVSRKLGDLCAAQPNLGMKFVEGELLEVRLWDLWIVEQFVDQLLNAINISLLEKAAGPMPRPAEKTSAAQAQ